MMMMINVNVNVNGNDKYCSKCGEALELERKDSYCRTCRSEYGKAWKHSNRDRVREYRKEYNDANKASKSEYNRKYWREVVAKSSFIYTIWSGDKCLYVGSSRNKYRAVHHIKGITHLELEPKDWAELGADKLIYYTVTDIISNIHERYFMEGLYIAMCEPLLNEEEPVGVDVDYSTMEKLEDIVYNGYIDREEIDIKKSSLNGKDSFNYDDLILR